MHIIIMQFQRSHLLNTPENANINASAKANNVSRISIKHGIT